MELHPDVVHFCNLLKELENLLKDHRGGFWVEEIQKCRRVVENSDAWGVHRFLGLFGGTGSLNDLILQRNGTILIEENHELDALLTKASRAAQDLVTDRS
jgi:hypothetical protein